MRGSCYLGLGLLACSYHQHLKDDTHFAGLDRNRSRSVGFMEGKDTIGLRAAGRAIPRNWTSAKRAHSWLTKQREREKKEEKITKISRDL